MHCISEKFTVGTFLVERNVVNDSPVYQRESGVWSDEKHQLFLDSLFNGYDIPKLYLHDLRGKDSRYKFAVIDGKQRLHAIWNFLDGIKSLADDFSLTDPGGRIPPKPGVKYSELSTDWQEIFKAKTLDVVLVQNADEDDIEELFSRLNNGEPLTAAEKRNAMGGDMSKLVRDTAKEPFFTERLRFKNTRYQHLEVAAKFLLIEKTESDGAGPFVDLKKRFLDQLVKNNKSMTKAASEKLMKSVKAQLRTVSRVFQKSDPLLQKQAYAPMYYLFIKVMNQEYASKTLFSDMRMFLEKFHASRASNLEKNEEERDPVLIEFGRLMQQGTNDLNSLKERVSILRRYFLQEKPGVEVKDKKREFTEEERLAIFILSGKKCANCGIEFKDISEMHADHKMQWAHGGSTSLTNGRALCEQCNKALAEKVS